MRVLIFLGHFFLLLQSVSRMCIETVNCILIGIGLLLAIYPYFFFASNLMSKFSDCSDRIYGCSSYKLPVKGQLDLNIILLYSQNERSLKGYGIECSLNTLFRVKLLFSIDRMKMKVYEVQTKIPTISLI